MHHLADYRGRVVVINFWSALCPWSGRTDTPLLEWMEDWGEDVTLLPVASNADETLELIRQVSGERGFPLVLRDAWQRAADRYAAQTTPHVFVVDAKGILRYQGAFDDVTFRQRTPTRHYLREVVDALLAGREPQVKTVPPYGCAIVRYLA